MATNLNKILFTTVAILHGYFKSLALTGWLLSHKRRKLIIAAYELPHKNVAFILVRRRNGPCTNVSKLPSQPFRPATAIISKIST